MFRTLSLSASVLSLCLVAATVHANDANVCRTKSLLQSNKESSLSNETSFTCGSGLTGTIPSLSKAGWKITSVMEQSDLTALYSLKAGHIPQNTDDLTKTFWLIVIQKD